MTWWVSKRASAYLQCYKIGLTIVAKTMCMVTGSMDGANAIQRSSGLITCLCEKVVYEKRRRKASGGRIPAEFAPHPMSAGGGRDVRDWRDLTARACSVQGMVVVVLRHVHAKEPKRIVNNLRRQLIVGQPFIMKTRKGARIGEATVEGQSDGKHGKMLRSLFPGLSRIAERLCVTFRRVWLASAPRRVWTVKNVGGDVG